MTRKPGDGRFFWILKKMRLAYLTKRVFGVYLMLVNQRNSETADKGKLSEMIGRKATGPEQKRVQGGLASEEWRKRPVRNPFLQKQGWVFLMERYKAKHG